MHLEIAGKARATVKRSWPPPPSLAAQVRQLSLSDPLEKLVSQASSVIFLGFLAFGGLLSFSSSSSSRHQGGLFFWFLLGGGLLSYLVYGFGRKFGRKKRTISFEESFHPIFVFLEGKGRSSFARSSQNVVSLIPKFHSQGRQSAPQTVPLGEAFDFLLLVLVQTIGLSENLGSAAPGSSVQALEESILEIQRLFIYYEAGILQKESGTQIGRSLLSSQIAAAEFQARAVEQALLLERQLVAGMQEIDKFLRETVGQNEQTIEKKAAAFFFQWVTLKQKIINDFSVFLTSLGQSC